MLHSHSYFQSSASQSSVENPPLEDSALLQERQEAYRYARYFGLSVEESEDCAADFVLHCLTRSLFFHDATAQRRTCAHNFACDAFRARARHIRAQTLSVAGFLESPHHSAFRFSPESALFQLTFWNLMQPTFNALPEKIQTMLLDHYKDGWTAKELADSLGQTEGAINQVLFRARRRLHLLLEKAGISRDDLSCY